MRRIAIGVIAAFAVLASSLPLPSAQAAFPGKNGKIAFFRQDDQEIYRVDPDGSNLTNLTEEGAAFPSWSADGTRIAFGSVGSPPGTHFQIHYMNGDGTGKTQVTSDPSTFKSEPAWSPDGTRIAFISTFAGSYTTLKVINADGSGERIVCCGPGYGDGTHIDSPSWSPDGTKIVFDRSPSLAPETFSLWTIEPAGTGLTRICCDSTGALAPDWSPDGQKILFWGGGRDLPSFYRVDADGSGLVRLYTRPTGGSIAGPRWSPDGAQIVFAQGATRFGKRAIYTMNAADGSALRQITQPPVDEFLGGDGMPSWQPIPAPSRGDYKNGAQFCKAEQAFWGDQFASRYGGGANAYGKCVSSK